MANWLLWPRSSGCNMAEMYESLLYWYQGEQSEFDANKAQTKKKHVTHHSSQNLLDPRNPRGPIQTCNIWTVDVTTPWRPPQWASWVCRTYSVCVGLVPGWESLKIRWLNYHLCHCPHWSLIYVDHLFMPIVVGNPCHHFQTPPRASESVQISFQHIRCCFFFNK